MHSYLFYWYSSPQKHRLFNSYISSDIKCLSVPNIQYLEWGLFTYFVDTVFDCCLPAVQSSLCPADDWADVPPCHLGRCCISEKKVKELAFIAVHQAAFEAPAHRNSFFSLVKKDYIGLQSFVWYSIDHLNF